MVFLNAPEDMKWLRDVHLHGLSPEYESAVVHGNEDSPAQIEVYRSREPLISDVPLIYLPDPNGDFKLQIDSVICHE